MSTFLGFVSEFPNIRIDYFRRLPGKPPALACFLSHVHSDHLVGLESHKSPFVYCSAATRELVLRLEKFPHRMNFAKGILECRRQTYKHLSKILRPLPLDTATTIQLSPSSSIQVTLLDANHCIGAVMFLVEGNGKAVLYTGDIRSEPWWVNNLTRHPSMIKYTVCDRHIDKLYLDTTFAEASDRYCEFPPKAEGIRELLRKLARYPMDTVFYFSAWTFGYEDVWRILASSLETKVHLDSYRYRLYTSVAKGNDTSITVPEASALCGFVFGNDRHAGILTNDESVRLHSCEKGSDCRTGDPSRSAIVTITPIISRYEGIEMHELGAGGGKGDLDQEHELELANASDLDMLLSICTEKIEDKALLDEVARALRRAMESGDHHLSLVDMEDFMLPDSDEIPLERLPSIIARLIGGQQTSTVPAPADPERTKQLPKTITFPYSRHSSYNELRELVAAFKPRDVWPCTAPPPDQWTDEISMQNLFGDLCSNDGEGFAYDNEMRELRANETRLKRKHSDIEDHESGLNQRSPRHDDSDTEDEFQDANQSRVSPEVPKSSLDNATKRATEASLPKQSPLRHLNIPETIGPFRGPSIYPGALGEDLHAEDSPVRGLVEALPVTPARERYRRRTEAYEAVREGRWSESIQLISTKRRD